MIYGRDEEINHSSYNVKIKSRDVRSLFSIGGRKVTKFSAITKIFPRNYAEFKYMRAFFI